VKKVLQLKGVVAWLKFARKSTTTKALQKIKE